MELAVQELLGFITSEYEGWSNTGMFVCPPTRERLYEPSGSRIRSVPNGISNGSLQAVMRRCAKERNIPYVKAVRRYDYRSVSVGSPPKLGGRTLMFRRVKKLDFLVAMFALFGRDGYKHRWHDDECTYFLGKSQFAVNIPEALWEETYKMIINLKQWRAVMRLDGGEQACLPEPTCTTRSKRSARSARSTAQPSTAG